MFLLFGAVVVVPRSLQAPFHAHARSSVHAIGAEPEEARANSKDHSSRDDGDDDDYYPQRVFKGSNGFPEMHNVF